MNLQQATGLIEQCAKRMDALYGSVLFDEWAIIQLENKKVRIITYNGPRRPTFAEDFDAAEDLIADLVSGEFGCGDFSFSRHAIGPQADALMVLGPGIYLICNNTKLSINEITQNPLWLQAQVPFVELGEKFRASPLVLQQD